LIPDIEGNAPFWMSNYQINDYDMVSKYIASFYFIVTCITTVGFGDISPQTTVERVFCIVMMFLGAMGFSFAAGSLSTILS